MFFESIWKIDRKGIPDIDKLFDAAADLNCILWYRSTVTNEGYRCARFIAQVPSIAVFEQFVNNTQNLPFGKWYEIKLQEAEIIPLDKPIRLSQWSGHNHSNFLNAFYVEASENETLQKKLDSN